MWKAQRATIITVPQTVSADYSKSDPAECHFLRWSPLNLPLEEGDTMLSDISTSRQHEEINSKLLLYQYEVSQECSAFIRSKQGHYAAVQRSMSCVSILRSCSTSCISMTIQSLYTAQTLSTGAAPFICW